MNFLAFLLGYHDSNVAIAIDGQIRYAKSERITGIKHHGAELDFVKSMCEQWGVKHFDAIAFSDIGNRHQLGVCDIDQLYREVPPFWGDTPTFRVDHHYSHILSAWPVTDMASVDVGVAIDSEGDCGMRCRIIGKPGSAQPKLLYQTSNRSFGSLLSQIGHRMGLAGTWLDFAGKIMGMQAYGSIDMEFVHSLDLDDIGSRILDLVTEVPWQGRAPADTPDFFKFDNPSFRNWVASVHYICEQYVLRLFGTCCNPADHIVLSGGCAQNTLCNEQLSQVYRSLHIPPHCYDGGISLGCLEFLRLYYGQKPFSNQGFPYWQTDEHPGEVSDGVIHQVARLLAEGKIVGWFQGHGEIGPRALGHRSILIDPRLQNAKDVLNQRVKHREHWRPYAPSVLARYAETWFELDRPSPYMLRAVRGREGYRDQIPAVIHEDGTSRVQTVEDATAGEQSPFSRLLGSFHEQTGIPLLLNTSLNAGGSPIFSTPQQCLELFQATDLDAMCIGDTLLVK